MALTPASILADYSSGIGTQGATLKVNTNEKRVGIGTTNPQGTLQVGTAITMGSGIVTATSFDANTASFSGNVSVGGVLTYEDVTSVDSVGIITARSDVHVGGDLSVTGVSTFTGITTSTTTLFANDFSVSGVSTLGGNVVVGGATTDLLVNGDARVTGILTVGTASLTLDGTTGKITGGSLTDAQVAAISSEISESDIVDVFVYDTSKDSDGGAWRKRTQHTSWYSETLNTATRGSRKEFPSVAVIVTTSDGSNDSAAEVRIYDGDDPDLPMWMVFQVSGGAGSTASRFAIPGVNNLRASVMLNGILCVAVNDSGSTGRAGLEIINFLSETTEHLSSALANGNVRSEDSIAKRNTAISNAPTDDSRALVNNAANDVAITVLPNAPIDDATGLPIPTIALATDGGVSVIKDDGTVVDIAEVSAAWSSNLVEFFDGKLIHNDHLTGTNSEDYLIVSDIPASDTNYLAGGVNYNHASTPKIVYSRTHDNTKLVSLINNTFALGSVDSTNHLTLLSHETTQSQSMVAFATTSYNTGWMHGDIKGAFLSGISTADVTGSDFITNGNFDDTDISYWTAANGATLTHQTNGNPGGNINVASGPSSNGYASRSHTVVVGKYYTLSFDHYHVDGSQGYVNIGTTTGGSEYIYQNLGTSSSWTPFSFTIKATSTNLFTGLYSRPNGNVRYDNIVLREADPDRSVNQNGLQVFGTVTKSAVAGSGDTAAELVAYSGFSASNYLQQPYNSDLDFGTGDLSISFWYKMTSTASPECILHRGDGASGTWGSGNIIQIEMDGTNLEFQIAGPSFSSITQVQVPVAQSATGQWQHFVGVRSGGVMSVYIDSVKYGNVASTQNATNTSAKTWIGERPNVSRPASNTSMTLFRMSASAPSAEQIKKMYEDEKVLFQENAACTLYGSSDAVTALGYDEITDQLYVGTSSGRSDFQGLRRINNTTQEVQTAISAHDTFIIEQ
jgi:hypothetical protein